VVGVFSQFLGNLRLNFDLCALLLDELGFFVSNILFLLSIGHNALHFSTLLGDLSSADFRIRCHSLDSFSSIFKSAQTV
jgi:hypothetical protein